MALSLVETKESYCKALRVFAALARFSPVE